MTSSQMPHLDLPESRLLYAAAIKDIGASGVKAAALGRIDRTRYIALQDDPLSRRSWLGDRHRGEQRLGVGMFRRAENLPLAPDLDDLAEIHHRHPMRHVLDDGEIMADEQHPQAELALQT